MSDFKFKEKYLNEPILEPDLPICDPHHHLWEGPEERGKYLVEDFLNDASNGHKIIKTVFVECGASYRNTGPDELKPVGETEFVIRVTSHSKHTSIEVAAGIIGFVDFTLGEKVPRTIEAHIEAGGKRFKGIRQSFAWNKNPKIHSMAKMPDLMSNSAFRKGFAYLRKYSLNFDAWLYFDQLPGLADLAHNFEDILIIVDHVGGILGIEQYTGKRDEVFQEWQRGIEQLAKCPNVLMKLGGLGMPRCGFGWQEMAGEPGSQEIASTIKPYILYCIEKFGVNRCMFESNFPMDKASYSYNTMWNAFKRIVSDFSHEEKLALFYKNAVRIYRLD